MIREISRINLFCPACGESVSVSTGIALDNGRGVRTYQRCLTCRSFFDPEPFDVESEVAHIKKMPWGEAIRGRQLAVYNLGMYRAVLNLLSRYCAPPATLLDFGCSFGGFLIEAQKANYVVKGSDINPEAVEYVQSLGIPAQTCKSIRDVSFVQDGTVDILTCLDTNYYWSDQPKELNSAFNKLRSGGYLVLRVVDKSWMFSAGLIMHKLFPALGQRVLGKAINDHRFSMPVSSLLKVIRSSGFDIVYASPKGALHSDQSGLPVKIGFGLGILFWSAFGIYVAPGALVISRKRSR